MPFINRIVIANTKCQGRGRMRGLESGGYGVAGERVVRVCPLRDFRGIGSWGMLEDNCAKINPFLGISEAVEQTITLTNHWLCCFDFRFSVVGAWCLTGTVSFTEARAPCTEPGLFTVLVLVHRAHVSRLAHRTRRFGAGTPRCACAQAPPALRHEHIDHPAGIKDQASSTEAVKLGGGIPSIENKNKNRNV